MTTIKRTKTSASITTHNSWHINEIYYIQLLYIDYASLKLATVFGPSFMLP